MSIEILRREVERSNSQNIQLGLPKVTILTCHAERILADFDRLQVITKAKGCATTTQEVERPEPPVMPSTKSTKFQWFANTKGELS